MVGTYNDVEKIRRKSRLQEISIHAAGEPLATACNYAGNGYVMLQTCYSMMAIVWDCYRLLQYNNYINYIAVMICIDLFHQHGSFAIGIGRMAWSPKPPSKALAKPEAEPPLEMVSIVHCHFAARAAQLCDLTEWSTLHTPATPYKQAARKVV